jgi:hypothetical protein
MDFEALQSYESKERIRPAIEAALEMGLFSSAKAFLSDIFKWLMVVMLHFLPHN